MSRCLQNQHTLAVAFIDLDGFKHINDEHGHDFGDDYLRAIANRLKATVRESDTVGRFGGDEFVLLLNNVGSQASHEHEAFNRIQKALSEPVSVHGRILPVSASIGVSLYPADNSCLDAEQLLRQADMAMYQGKHSGKGKLVVFKPEPVMEITERRH